MMGQDTDRTRASTITLIMAFVISGIFLMTDRGSERLLSQTATGVEAGFAPALALLSTPLRALENVFTEFQDRSRAVEENKALREELYALREDKQRAQIMEMKLARLEEILGSDSGVDIPAKKIAARAVSEINGPFVRSALINAGMNKGIKKGHPVMTVHGLYGHVLRSGPNSARVLQLGDLNSRISVMSARSQARAILSGDNSDLPLLVFVENRDDWREGDKVLSSGDGGILPQGLPVGEVQVNEADQFVVRLGTTGKPTDWVWVYPYVPTEEPQDTLNEDTLNEGAEKEAEAVDEASAVLPDPDTPKPNRPESNMPEPGTP